MEEWGPGVASITISRSALARLRSGDNIRRRAENARAQGEVLSVGSVLSAAGLGTLAAVGVCDASNRSLSSVYFYFDPAESRRGLGNFGVLQEIDFCRRHGIAHLYLGYWVCDAPAMSYKTRYLPYELLCTDGVWRAPAGAQC